MVRDWSAHRSPTPHLNYITQFLGQFSFAFPQHLAIPSPRSNAKNVLPNSCFGTPLPYPSDVAVLAAVLVTPETDVNFNRQTLLRQSARPAAMRAPMVQTAFRAPLSPLTPFQARLLSDQTRAAIDKAVASAPVVLFMKGTPETPQCGFSRAAIQILGIQGVNPDKFAAFNVLEDPELREGIKEYSDWPTIPQLYVEKDFVGGCDILVSMHQNGDLAKLLEEKKVVIEAESEKKE